MTSLSSGHASSACESGSEGGEDRDRPNKNKTRQERKRNRDHINEDLLKDYMQEFNETLLLSLRSQEEQFSKTLQIAFGDLKTQTAGLKTELVAMNSGISEIRTELLAVKNQHKEATLSNSDLKEEQYQIHTEFRELRRSLEFNSEQIKDFDCRLRKTIAKGSEKTESELQSLPVPVNKLEYELSQQQQNKRQLNLESLGVPESRGEEEKEKEMFIYEGLDPRLYWSQKTWYFGDLSREEATKLLLNETDSGVFLVRDSKTNPGDYVLCVRQADRVSQYIINRVVSADGTTRYRIKDQLQLFADMPALLAFYLDTIPLVRPLPQAAAAAPAHPMQVIEVVVAKYDFFGNDTGDLPFRRGEHLMVVNRDEEQWWTARNSQGRTGSIPVPYVERLLDPKGVPNEALTQLGDPPSPQGQKQRTNMRRTLPALARVRQTRVPNAYDKTALKLEEGDIITVTKKNINGQWEGELNGKVGHFPFTCVELLDDNTAS